MWKSQLWLKEARARPQSRAPSAPTTVRAVDLFFSCKSPFQIFIHLKIKNSAQNSPVGGGAGALVYPEPWGEVKQLIMAVKYVSDS